MCEKCLNVSFFWNTEILEEHSILGLSSWLLVRVRFTGRDGPAGVRLAVELAEVCKYLINLPILSFLVGERER